MDHAQAPLYDKLVSHAFGQPASFHVPGHKFGAGLDPDAADVFRRIMTIDCTEISGLDDLHSPRGVIDQAQRLAADCFGAERTFFLVGGSTVGNLALVLSLCGANDLLIVQRNVHKSVIHGLMLAGARAVFLPPRWDARTGQATGVAAEDVERALRLYPEAKGVFVGNPNYYGMGVRLEPIVEAAHARGVPLVVDEAHGAHFGFHPQVPASAMSCGADASVQSTHKMLTAMTMGAMLHLQGDRLDRERIARRLSLLQSSSPSYPIMASLDLARRQMRRYGADWIERGLEAVAEFKRLLNRLPGFEAPVDAPGPPGSAGGAHETQDPFKVAVRALSPALSGYQLQRRLERQGCFVEMSDPLQVLLVFSIASTQDDAHRCFEALRRISCDFSADQQEQPPSVANLYQIPQYTEMTAPVQFDLDRPAASGPRPRQTAVRAVRLEEAAGRQAAEMVIPYPPGIPVLYAGERVTPQTVAYLSALSRQGASFQGVQDPTLQTIRIFGECRDEEVGHRR